MFGSISSWQCSNWTFIYICENVTNYWFTQRRWGARQKTVQLCLLPALAGRCGNPGDTAFLCRAGCCGDRRRGSVRVEVTKEVVVTRAPLGLLLNWRAAAAAAAFWLDTGTVTGMEKVGCGTVDWWKDRKKAGLSLMCTCAHTDTYLYTVMDRWSVSDLQQSRRARRWKSVTPTSLLTTRVFPKTHQPLYDYIKCYLSSSNVLWD